MDFNDEILKKTLSFDLYGRYAIMRDIINVNRTTAETRLKILDVGGRGNFMKKFFENDDVYYLEPDIESFDKNFIKGDGCAMQLEDNSFDWVVSADVFEHIPKEKRESFLRENIRVAKYGVILTAPFYSKELYEAEINANNSYKILSGGKDHIWLKEHIQNGLPYEKIVEDYLNSKNLKFQKLHNNQLLLWELLLGVSLYINENIDEEIKKEIESFNYFYNTKVLPVEGVEPSYRKIYFIKKNVDVKNLNTEKKHIDDLLFLQIIKRAIDVVNKISVKNKVKVQKIDEVLGEFPLVHFYSPIPDIEEIKTYEQKIWGHMPKTLPGIDLNTEEQLQLFQQFKQYYKDLPFQEQPVDGLRYYYLNPSYSYADAISLYCMMRFCKPKRIIEIGSGFSSFAMMDTNERFFDNKIEITFIEPDPKLLYSRMQGNDRQQYHVMAQKLQDVDFSIFNTLEENDILFIDSTHVSKVNSDVNHIFFEILPALTKGVCIHFHDIFYPFEYPKEWIMNNRRAWTEDYILRAFLEYNKDFALSKLKCNQTDIR